MQPLFQLRCVQVCHVLAPCKNSCMDQRSVSGEDFWRPKEHSIKWGPNPPTVRGRRSWEINYDTVWSGGVGSE